MLHNNIFVLRGMSVFLGNVLEFNYVIFATTFIKKHHFQIWYNYSYVIPLIFIKDFMLELPVVIWLVYVRRELFSIHFVIVLGESCMATWQVRICYRQKPYCRMALMSTHKHFLMMTAWNRHNINGGSQFLLGMGIPILNFVRK